MQNNHLVIVVTRTNHEDCLMVTWTACSFWLCGYSSLVQILPYHTAVKYQKPDTMYTYVHVHKK